MEALEFMRKRKIMCEYYGDDTCVCDDSRGTCPALFIDCSFGTQIPERLIAIVEKWAKEHPEEAEQKRKNKDALLEAFQNARVDKNGIPDMCPIVLDSQYDCNAFASCSLCKYTHWLAEVEE